MRKLWIASAALALAACQKPVDDKMTGYGEANYTFASAFDGGRIEEMLVKEGATVEAGAPLFRIEALRNQDSAVAAGASASAARLRSAAALAEAVRQARAGLDLARQNLARSKALRDQGFVAQAKLDADRSAYEQAAAALEQAEAEKSAAALDAKAAEAQAALASRRVKDTAVVAATRGRVERIYHRTGEIVGPGDPVLSMIAPGDMRVRFFAPEAMLPKLKPGAIVQVSCDGCAKPIPARVSFVADEAQFTPPVIYSIEERGKLVFMVEAIPDDPAAIRPGLPVDVRAAS